MEKLFNWVSFFIFFSLSPEIQQAPPVLPFLETPLTFVTRYLPAAIYRWLVRNFRESHTLSPCNKDPHWKINLTMRKLLWIFILANPFQFRGVFRILTLLNRRHLEKLKEKWWKKEEVSGKCEKPEDQSDGISIQNIGGVFIVIFVGIGMACVTLLFEFWYYKFRKIPKIVGGEATDYQNNKFIKNASIKNVSSFSSTGGLIDTGSNNTLKSRNPQAANFRARF